jgi:hypothetical protein
MLDFPVFSTRSLPGSSSRSSAGESIPLSSVEKSPLPQGRGGKGCTSIFYFERFDCAILFYISCKALRPSGKYIHSFGMIVTLRVGSSPTDWVLTLG